MFAGLCALALVGVGVRSSNASFAKTTGTDNSFRMRTVAEVRADATWWLDGNDLGTLYQDNACTLPVNATGQAVRCWKDANNGRPITLVDAGVPVFSTNPIAGRRSVRFDFGRLAGPDLFGGTITDAHVFVVTRENVREQNRTFNLNGDEIATGRFSAHAPWPDGNVYFDPGDLAYNRTVVPGPPLGTTILLNGWKDSTAAKNGLSVNGGPVFQSASFSVAPSAGGLRIGENRSDIAEVLIFPRRLSAGEEAMVEDYLAIKWNVAMA